MRAAQNRPYCRAGWGPWDACPRLATIWSSSGLLAEHPMGMEMGKAVYHAGWPSSHRSMTMIVVFPKLLLTATTTASPRRRRVLLPAARDWRRDHEPVANEA